MLDYTGTIHEIGGDTLIAELQDRDWQAEPDEVKQLAREIRRLRTALDETDLIEGRTIMRIEVDFGEVYRSVRDGVSGQCLVITAPSRLECDPDFGAIVADGVREAVNEFIRQWVELVKKTTDANS